MESRLSLTTKIIHTIQIPICGYLYILINTLQKLKLINVFIIDEMSLLTNIMLSSIYTRTKQKKVQNHYSFSYKIILLVGHLTQLLLICHH